MVLYKGLMVCFGRYVILFICLCQIFIRNMQGNMEQVMESMILAWRLTGTVQSNYLMELFFMYSSENPKQRGYKYKQEICPKHHIPEGERENVQSAAFGPIIFTPSHFVHEYITFHRERKPRL